MENRKPVGSLLLLLLGLVGTAACIAVTIQVWSIGRRLNQATELVLERVSQSVAVARDRVAEAQNRVESSKITADKLQESLRDWSKQEVAERVSWQLNIAERAQRLDTTLQQTDRCLEVSETVVQSAQQLLVIAASAGASADGSLFGDVQDDIGALRGQVAEASSIVASLRERTEKAEEDSGGGRLQEAAQLALRAGTTLGVIGGRLTEFEDRLVETRVLLRDLQKRAFRWILLAATGITLFLAWCGGGQVALCVLGWRGLSRTAKPA